MKNNKKEFEERREYLSKSAYDNLLGKEAKVKQDKINKNDKKISIIIPTHNRLEQLTQLLNSIFNQSYQNFEILIIDDLSQDETNKVYSNHKDERIKYYLNPENLGMGLNRQKGFNLATGDYIIFCDDDDYYIDYDYFKEAIKIFEDKEVNIICSSSYIHYETEDVYEYYNLNMKKGLINSIDYLKRFMFEYKKPTSTFPAIFRVEALRKANFKEMTMMNDSSIYMRAMMIGGKTYINDKIVGIYRVHGMNDTFNVKADFIIKNLEEKRLVNDYLIENNLLNNKEWYANQIFITVNHFLNGKERDKKEIDKVLLWVKKNVSYKEYLRYKKIVKKRK